MIERRIVLSFLLLIFSTLLVSQDDGSHPGRVVFDYSDHKVTILDQRFGAEDSSFFEMGRVFTDQFIVDIWEGADRVNSKLFLDQISDDDFIIDYAFNVDACHYRFIIRNDQIGLQRLCGIDQAYEQVVHHAFVSGDSLTYDLAGGQMTMFINEDMVYSASTGIEEVQFSKITVGFYDADATLGRLVFNESTCDMPCVNAGFEDLCVGDNCNVMGNPGIITGTHDGGGDYFCSCYACEDFDSDGVCDENDICQGCDDATIGLACDDGKAYTTNDINRCVPVVGEGDGLPIPGIFTCSCSGDLICSFGASCDDGDPCTENDRFDSTCNCTGTETDDYDGDGICDALDEYPHCDNSMINQPCTPDNPCIVNARYNTECDCVGTLTGDYDGDNICDAEDEYPNCDNSLVNQPCTPANPCVVDARYDANCNCIGTLTGDDDNDGICDAQDDYPNCDNSLVNQSCTPTNPCEINARYDANCDCVGTVTGDTDGDTICDAQDPCPNLAGLENGDACDDLNPCTSDDMVVNCICTGTLAAEVCDGVDNDCDGVIDEGLNCVNTEDCSNQVDDDGDNLIDCDDIDDCDCVCDDDGDNVNNCDDDCPNFNNNLIGTNCDNGDVCTEGSIYESDCGCSDGILIDEDGDGFCDITEDCDPSNANINPDAQEICDGVDNNCDGIVDEGCTFQEDCSNMIDDDGDGLIDCMDTFDCNCDCDLDSDGDGVVDCDDTCQGFDNELIGMPCDDGDVCTEDSYYLSNCTCGGGTLIDDDGDGYCDVTEDCDPTNADINPGAVEICNGLDDDCNGIADDNISCDGETCSDGIQNGDEEEVDCGGSCAPCPKCDDGKRNGDEEGIDCGGSCNPCPTCNDGVLNGNETDVDCGGPDCPDCVVPSCMDGVQNGNETGVDCGGGCPPCDTCGDGIQNGDETDVDCGGPDCPACIIEVCQITDADCDDGNPITVDYVTDDCECKHRVDNCQDVDCDDGKHYTRDGRTFQSPCECFYICERPLDFCDDGDPTTHHNLVNCECVECTLTPASCDDGDADTDDTVNYENCSCVNTCNIRTFLECPEKPNQRVTTFSSFYCNCSYECLLAPSACDDQNPNTEDILEEFMCECFNNCTLTEASCNDGDPFTDDSLDSENCQCLNVCNQPVEVCDDNNPYTLDRINPETCACSYICVTQGGLAAEAVDPATIECDDGIATTTDYFDESICDCVNQCDIPASCDDNNEYTHDSFDPSICACVHICAITVAACDDGDPCTDDILTADCNCENLPSSADSDGDGVLDCEDCDPNNTNLPGAPGTACDDANPDTYMDYLETDGCTCVGYTCERLRPAVDVFVSPASCYEPGLVWFDMDPIDGVEVSLDGGSTYSTNLNQEVPIGLYNIWIRWNNQNCSEQLTTVRVEEQNSCDLAQVSLETSCCEATVAVTDNCSDYHIQWQTKRIEESSWSDLSVASADRLVIGQLSEPYKSSNGFQYRAEITFTDPGLPQGAGCHMRSAIFSPDLDVVADLYNTCVLRATHETDGPACAGLLSYQWEYRASIADDYEDVATASSSAYLAVQDGYYRAKVYFGNTDLDISQQCYRVSDELHVTACSLSLELGDDHVVCHGDVVDLSPVTTGQIASYLWSTGEVTPMITIGTGQLEEGITIYALTITDQWGRTAEDEVSITTVTAPSGTIVTTDEKCGELGVIQIEEDLYDHPVAGTAIYSIDGGLTYSPRSEHQVPEGTYDVWISWSSLDCPAPIGTAMIQSFSACELATIDVSADCCSMTVTISESCVEPIVRWEVRREGTTTWIDLQLEESITVLDIGTLPETYRLDPTWQFRPVVSYDDPSIEGGCEKVGGWIQFDYMAELTADACMISATLDPDITCDAAISSYEWKLMATGRDDYLALEQTTASITATKDGYYMAKVTLDNGCARYSEPLLIEDCIDCTNDDGQEIAVDLGADRYLCYGRETRVDLDPIIIAPEGTTITWTTSTESTVIPIYPLYPELQDIGNQKVSEDVTYTYTIQVSDETEQCVVSDEVSVHILQEVDVEITTTSGECGEQGAILFDFGLPARNQIIEVSIDGSLSYSYTIDLSATDRSINITPGVYDVYIRRPQAGCDIRKGYIEVSEEPVDCDLDDCPILQIASVESTGPEDCSDLTSGTITIIPDGVPGPSDRFSIDGEHFQESPVFTDLLPGEYTVYSMYEHTGCLVSTFVNVDVPECLYCEVIDHLELSQTGFVRIEYNFEENSGPLDPYFLEAEILEDLIDDFSMVRFCLSSEIESFPSRLDDTTFIRLDKWKEKGGDFRQTDFINIPLLDRVSIMSDFKLKEHLATVAPVFCAFVEPDLSDNCDFDISLSTCLTSATGATQALQITLHNFQSGQLYEVAIYGPDGVSDVLTTTSMRGPDAVITVPRREGFIVQVMDTDNCIEALSIPSTINMPTSIDLQIGACLDNISQLIIDRLGCDMIEDASCITWQADESIIRTQDDDNDDDNDDDCTQLVIGDGIATIIITKDGEIISEWPILITINNVDGDELTNDQDPDIDGDGIPNGLDDDIDGDGIPNDLDDDMDGDGNANDQDDVADGTDTEDCSTPEDDDGDGLAGCEDPDCGGPDHELVIQVSVDQHTVCDGQTGQISVEIEGEDLSDYKICFGDRCVDSSTGILNGLGGGDYDMTVTTFSGCEVSFRISEEICGNGKDDDGDGFADCDDLDCWIEDADEDELVKDQLKSDDCNFDLLTTICLNDNSNYFKELRIKDFESAAKICLALREFDSDYNDNNNEEEFEYQNCIEITRNGPMFLFPSFEENLIAKTPDRMRTQKEFEPLEKGGDLSSGKYTREEAIDLVLLDNLLDPAKTSVDDLFFKMGTLIDVLTNHVYDPVGESYIDFFRNGQGEDVADLSLLLALKETTEFKNKVKLFGQAFNCSLDLEECGVDESCEISNPGPFDYPFRYDGEITRFQWKKWQYYRPGPKILVNDTEQIFYHLKSFENGDNNGDWNACFHIEMIDHFGLDTDDLTGFQKTPVVGEDFAAWWILQHVYGFKPFRSTLIFEVCIEGNVYNCDCD